MLNKVFIRADGSSEIGLGHLIRCNALALMLKNEFQIIFACKEIPIEIFTKISNNGFHIQSIDSEDDFFKILSKDEIVVIDHYGLDTNYQKKIKELGCKLVCIDDLHDKEFFADVIINHAEGILAKDYSCKPYTKLFLGIKYALLRHPFLLASEEENRIIDSISNCFVCFGGSDFENYTLDTVKQLVEIDSIKKINIVIGSGYLYSNELAIFCKANSSHEIIIYNNLSADALVTVMLNSELAIVPSSSILYEVLSVKMPIITGYTAENQKFIYESFVEKNLAVGIGSFPIKEMEQKIKLLYSKMSQMAVNQNHFFDGKSSERILNIFKDLIS